MIYVLDTSIFSMLEFAHQRVVEVIEAKLSSEVCHLVVSSVTVEESLGGWYTLLRRAKGFAEQARVHEALARAVSLLAQFRIVPMTETALRLADDFVKSKMNVARADLKIAAISIELGATVATRNLRDFNRVPGVVCEDWSV